MEDVWEQKNRMMEVKMGKVRRYMKSSTYGRAVKRYMKPAGKSKGLDQRSAEILATKTVGFNSRTTKVRKKRTLNVFGGYWP